MKRAKQMTKQGAIVLFSLGAGFLLGMLYATPQEEMTIKGWLRSQIFEE